LAKAGGTGGLRSELLQPGTNAASGKPAANRISDLLGRCAP